MENTTHSMNPFFWKTFSSLQESVCSNLQINGFKSKNSFYIIEMVGTIEALLGEGCIDSVILFGSLSYDSISKISDVDLLIILKNAIHYSQIRGIEGILKTIEIKYNFARYPKNIISRILRAVEKTTGMFCSHFLCLKKDWDNNDFARIFSTFKPFTYLLAPDKVVLDSMKSGAKLLFGNTPIITQQTHYNQRQILKSLIMNFFLYCGGLAMLPFGDKHVSYILESFKWSLRTMYFFIFQKTQKLVQIVQIAKKIGINSKILERFMQLRVQPMMDLKFILKLPFHIVRLHVLLYLFLYQ